jgi:hypothetical protein
MLTTDKPFARPNRFLTLQFALLQSIGQLVLFSFPAVGTAPSVPWTTTSAIELIFVSHAESTFFVCHLPCVSLALLCLLFLSCCLVSF